MWTVSHRSMIARVARPLSLHRLSLGAVALVLAVSSLSLPAKAAGKANLIQRSARSSRDRAFPKPVSLSVLRRVVLDPGHGGSNLGALGYHAIQEKALTLEISRFIADFIQRHSNLEVLLTRHDDRDMALRERPRWANAREADVLISVHCNSSPSPRPRGMEVWFLSADTSQEIGHEIVRREEEAKPIDTALPLSAPVSDILLEMRQARVHELSEAFALSLASGLRRGRPQARFRGVKQAPFAVLKEAEMPAVVLEVGYLSHPKESLELLKRETQLQLARGVLYGLQRYDRLLLRQRRASSHVVGRKRTKARKTTP